MDKSILFIKRFKCICLSSYTLKEALNTGYFDFISFTKSGKSIPTDGSVSLFCDKISTQDMPNIKPVKVVNHKDGTSSALYENIGYIRFYPKY